MDLLFLELVQVSLGQRVVLSSIPSETDWKSIYVNAIKQALVGVCFYGVQKLYVKYPEQVCNLPEKLRHHWMTLAFKIQRRNLLLNQQCKIVQDKFLDAGFETSILKGQGVASYYDDELKLYRQSGDIDVWINAPCDEVMAYVNSISPNREFDMKHTHLELFPDTIVEVHWWPSMPINPLYRKALQSYYSRQGSLQCKHKVKLDDDIYITAPDAQFEVVHVLSHIFNHFLYEGIGLRQFIDLYFVLVNGDFSQSAKTEILQVFKNIGLFSFAQAAMWVLCDILKMPENYSIGNIDEHLGKILYDEIETGGNFGFHNVENNVKNESFAHRMLRRMKRRLRLIRYNFIGFVLSPITKIKIILWKRKMIELYNL